MTAMPQDMDRTSAALSHTYEEAVCALNTLQTNAATIARCVAERDQRRHLSIPETIQHAKRAGLSLDEIDRLSMIHVSGTKGKGSTCAFCESMLRAQGFKTGFFSSPHLVEVRERIRINGKPLSKEAFSTYFWDCYRKLEDTKARSEDGSMPPYFRFLTIMAFHAFLQENVDVAIIEVGIGGQYDSTNIIRSPVVCGVSSLGMDHMQILGDSIHKIAWQKAGIFKPGVPAFTVQQPDNSINILQKRAQELGSPLWVAPALDDAGYTWLSGGIGGGVTDGGPPPLGIPGVMQQQNASLALQLCRTWLQDRKKDVAERTAAYTITCQKQRELQPTGTVAVVAEADGYAVAAELVAGLCATRWPGRSQILARPDHRLTYYIDGAHTTRSMEACVKWFKAAADEELRTIQGRVVRVLLFNTTGERRPDSLLQHLVTCGFDAAVFCPNIANTLDNTLKADQVNYMVTTDSQLNKCEENRNSWLSLVLREPNGELSPREEPPAAAAAAMPTHTFTSINSAILWATQQREAELAEYGEGEANKLTLPEALVDPAHIQVLCTGSLHLVGGVLGLIDSSLRQSLQ